MDKRLETLHSLIDYDPDAGRITFKRRDRVYFETDRQFATWNSRFAGRPAVNVAHSHGYLVGRVNSQMYKAHRLAFALHYGRWPEGEIDHINGDKSDNRISNLREVSTLRNGKNRPKQANNTSGVTGVAYSAAKRKWFARIKVSQKLIHLGYFESMPEAVSARRSAEIKFGFSARHGK